MNAPNPRVTHILFTASVVMITISLVLSVVNVATVLSAPRESVVTVPNLVGFEGFVADSSGNPITDGTYSITFKVYDAATAGNTLWTEVQSSVPVTKGIYSVTLGSVTALSANLFNGNRWIGVTVGTGTEMTPRTRVSSVPFALNADSANKVGGATGMIALFDIACPSGWSEVTSARGRVVVGVPAGGTLSGTQGNALSNLGTRVITNVPAHSHDAGTLTASSAGAHTHTFGRGGGGAGSYAAPGVDASFGNQTTNSGGAHTHVITGTTAVTGTASVDVTMPYIQLSYCKLNP